MNVPRQRQPRIKSPSHLAFLRRLPCLISRQSVSVEAAHIRFADAARGKFNPGVGQKPSDCYAVPLSSWHHRLAPDSQHNSGDERAWWEGHGIDVLGVAEKLWDATGDLEAGERIIAECKRKGRQW